MLDDAATPTGTNPSAEPPHSVTDPPGWAAQLPRRIFSELGQDNSNLNWEWRPFPLGHLPPPARSFVEEAAEAIQCDAAQVALPLLAGLAGAVGTARAALLKATWREPAVVWSAVVAESGTQKSAAAGAALEFVEREEARTFTQAGRRLLVSDTTVEALATALSKNPRGVLLARDELAGWLGSFNQYKGGRGSDAALWLSMHRAGPLLVDRKSGPAPTIRVPRAAVSITGTIQPAILERSLGWEHFENGLAARFLMAMPPARAKVWTKAVISDETRDRMKKVFRRLFALDAASGGRQRDVPLSGEAETIWAEFYNAHAQNQTRLTGRDAAAWSKAEGYAARLALLVRLVRAADSEADMESPISIEAEDIQAGGSLAWWFGFEAMRIYGVLGHSAVDREAHMLTALIARHAGKISPRDLSRYVHKFRGRTDEAERALEGLVMRGWGFWSTGGERSQRGRPTREFMLRSHIGEG